MHPEKDLGFAQSPLCGDALLFVIVRRLSPPASEPEATQRASQDVLVLRGDDEASWSFLAGEREERASAMRVIKCHKGVRWMPWHREAMKDVVRCDKLWGGANNL